MHAGVCVCVCVRACAAAAGRILSFRLFNILIVTWTKSMYELWMKFQHFDWHMDVVDV